MSRTIQLVLPLAPLILLVGSQGAVSQTAGPTPSPTPDCRAVSVEQRQMNDEMLKYCQGRVQWDLTKLVPGNTLCGPRPVAFRLILQEVARLCSADLETATSKVRMLNVVATSAQEISFQSKGAALYFQATLDDSYLKSHWSEEETKLRTKMGMLIGLKAEVGQAPAPVGGVPPTGSTNLPSSHPALTEGEVPSAPVSGFSLKIEEVDPKDRSRYTELQNRWMTKLMEYQVKLQMIMQKPRISREEELLKKAEADKALADFKAFDLETRTELAKLKTLK